MNILVDGRPFIRSSAGISTVLRCVLETWALQRKEDKLYVVMPKSMHESIAKYKFPDNVEFIYLKSFIWQNMPNLVSLNFVVPKLIRLLGINVYFSPVPNLPVFIPKTITKVVFVHDVVNLEFIETMAFRNRLASSLFYNHSIKTSDVLWANSRYTKERIEAYFPHRKCINIFVGCAVDRSLYRELHLNPMEQSEVKRKYGIKNGFLLFVGSLEPRKNLPFLLSLMPEIYSKTGLQLVVVGAKGWKNSDIKQIVERENFPKDCTIFCGYVTNEDLVLLYNTADSFVSTSLNEGFGLPQLEALLCGCPVVTAKNSAMVEVAKNVEGAVLVEGYDKDTWIKKITNHITNHPKVDTSSLQRYTWDTIIHNFLSSNFS